MTKKRLSDGGDVIVLGDAARAERGLLTRRRQLPALLVFVVIALLSAVYRLLVGLEIVLP